MAFAAVATHAGGQSKADTLSIRFDLGIPTLSNSATTTIDKWLYNDRIVNGKSILIVGYADHLGSDEMNDTLSKKRAANVRDYLVNMGLNKADIKLVIGKGEVKRTVERADGYPVDRRVDIVISDKKIIASKPLKPKPAPPRRDTGKIATTSPPTTIEEAKPGETIRMDRIFFYAGRHYVRQESIAELDKLYRTLEANPDLKIQIEGHVCCVRSSDALDEDTFEMALSVNRARHIYDYLIKRGIDRDRLKYRGFGRTRPIIANEITEADGNMNRRVEIRILEN
jgi:outer membrane protein OmpA-like peptidoglycan-associated protein